MPTFTYFNVIILLGCYFMEYADDHPTGPRKVEDIKLIRHLNPGISIKMAKELWEEAAITHFRYKGGKFKINPRAEVIVKGVDAVDLARALGYQTTLGQTELGKDERGPKAVFVEVKEDRTERNPYPPVLDLHRDV